MKRSYNYNKNNPLFDYYLKKREENKGKRVDVWRIISNETGLPVQTVISVSRNQNTDDVKRMFLGTYIKIKDSIGIDMLSFKEVDYSKC